MRYTFDTVVLGSSIDAALVTATEQARWLRANPGRREFDKPETLALALKDERVIIDPPTRRTADQLVRLITSNRKPPRDIAKLIEKARAYVADPHGPAVVIPMRYNEVTRECARRGIKTRPVRPAMARVIGVVQIPSKALAVAA